MVTILKYKKITIYHDIYIKVLSGVTFYYPKFSTTDDLNNTNNETEIPEPTRVFEEHSEMRFQEGSDIKYLNLRIFQSPIGFSVNHTDHIMELINKWFPAETFIRVHATFSTDSIYDN